MGCIIPVGKAQLLKNVQLECFVFLISTTTDDYYRQSSSLLSSSLKISEYIFKSVKNIFSKLKKKKSQIYILKIFKKKKCQKHIFKKYQKYI